MGWSAGMGIASAKGKNKDEGSSSLRRRTEKRMFTAAVRPRTLLVFVPAGVHVGQRDVGVAQALDPPDHLAPLLLHLADDLLGHVRALLQEEDLA